MTTLVRRSCFDEVGHYDENLFYEDWDMWLRIARRYRYIYSSFVAAKYRLTAGSAIRSRHIEVMESRVRICLRLLEENPDYLKSVARHLIDGSEILYKIGDGSRNKYLLENLKKRRDARALVLYLCSVLRLPYSIFSETRKLFRQFKRL
jgi:hypothetical protein